MSPIIESYPNETTPNAIPPGIMERAKKIRLLAMDVDGVLTPNSLLYSSNGDEIKVYNVKDGQGLSLLSQAGITLAMITARNTPANHRRGEELGFRYIFQNAKQKYTFLERILAENNWELDQVAYMGDDLPDLSILKVVGFSTCPNDAAPEIQTVVHWKSQYSGGHGAIRELTDIIRHAQALYPEFNPHRIP